ncbi:hypothetical protein WICPIJ_002846 [Wickerhamomyces pijperi]|uniref:Uncharacterized protein n=1 Tax=Wickerhamomyces pijperi TaxID=599730 RepID=A0A9P8TNJ9_WICPI|nr:hypothetical protein WICPIJ_002846 [Wickerhamomyces pijperi]
MMDSKNYYNNSQQQPPSSATQHPPQPHFPDFNPASLRNASPLVNNGMYNSNQQQQQQMSQPLYNQYLQPSALDQSDNSHNFHHMPPTSNLALSNPPSSASTGVPQHQLLQSSLLLSPPLTSANLSKQPLLQSPSLNFSSLYSSRARFNASKGFDIEDDMEFCPMTQAQRAEAKALELQLAQTSSPTSSASGPGHVNPYANYFSGNHHKFNPYSSSFSPSSPSLGGNASLSNNISTGNSNGNYVTSPKNASSVNDSSPRVLTPRGKRLDQGNGISRVSSPRIYK